ncbi:MAG TPA: DUF389 domain-containing protein [Sphingomicrobium sp.]|nr:DUF389 domain-containing protein [Sphingomicrobium sp.]
MLISPLMGPAVGLGFALATFDSREMRRSSVALAVGIALAVLFCAAIVALSPLQTVTAEISSRTRPTLFDLVVALLAGLAGTYAMIRGRHGTIVGVIIATALMPPLAVMGFGLATANWPILSGSSLLFFTNLMTIAAAAAVLARLYGFAPKLSPQQSRLQVTIITTVLLVLAVPLALSLRQIAREVVAGSEASQTIARQFPKDARISDLDIDFQARPVDVSATVFTPEYRDGAERELRAPLARLIGEPIALSVDQILTETGSKATAVPSQAQRNASRMAERLALVAGVPVTSVILDRGSKRAVVRAVPIAGADLTAYRTLEDRVARTDSSWTIELQPPPAPLPDIEVDGDTVDRTALDTAIWAGRRVGLPIRVSGGGQEHSERVADLLRKSGIEATVTSPGAKPGPVSLRWIVPSEEDSRR